MKSALGGSGFSLGPQLWCHCQNVSILDTGGYFTMHPFASGHSHLSLDFTAVHATDLHVPGDTEYDESPTSDMLKKNKNKNLMLKSYSWREIWPHLRGLHWAVEPVAHWLCILKSSGVDLRRLPTPSDTHRRSRSAHWNEL